MRSEYIQQLRDTRRMIEFKDNLSEGPVVYLMNRDQRTIDNHALTFAQSLAMTHNNPLSVLFVLDIESQRYNQRQIPFLLQGLEQVAETLNGYNIPFSIREGDTVQELMGYVAENGVGSVVLDFSPLKKDKQVKEILYNNLQSNIYVVDAHNIVPCWKASDKREYAAYTIRPKIMKLLNEHSEKPLPVTRHTANMIDAGNRINWKRLHQKYNDASFINDFQPGQEAALKQLEYFVEHSLERYADDRNDPTKARQSNLSPYIHFGQISTRTILERIEMSQKLESSKEQFIDELVIRKELSDNFCYYTKEYDSFDAFPDWAKNSLNLHRKDPRPKIYTLAQFENADTDDPLWNAAQNEMVYTGKMHGYMRMYWAKKILEWSDTPENALKYAIYLNDRYELDGNDPNGYAGIAWSIGGLHDRAWFEREIYGKVRYMNANGCKRKFDTSAYIKQNNSQNRLNTV